MAFKKAIKLDSKLRMALTGPSGSGKTFSALAIATGLGGSIALIDTERGSASKYADLFEFDVCELSSFHPQRYIDAIREAEAAGYAILIIDSLSHAWMGKDGALELVDKAAKASKSQNSYVAWRDVTPLQNALVDAITGSACHVIVTMRTKTEYAQEKDDRGKTVIRKVGLAPVQRDGLEHEFDVVGELDYTNTLVISKSRCPALQGAVIEKPGKEVAEVLAAWLKGEKPPEIPKAAGTKAAPSDPPAPGNSKDSDADAKLREGLEAWIRESGIDRELFKEFLAASGDLEAGSDDKLHLHDLPVAKIQAIRAAKPETAAAFRAWEGRRQLVIFLQEAEIDESAFLRFLAQDPAYLRPDECGTLSLASVPSEKLTYLVSAWQREILPLFRAWEKIKQYPWETQGSPQSRDLPTHSPDSYHCEGCHQQHTGMPVMLTVNGVSYPYGPECVAKAAEEA